MTPDEARQELPALLFAMGAILITVTAMVLYLQPKDHSARQTVCEWVQVYNTHRCESL